MRWLGLAVVAGVISTHAAAAADLFDRVADIETAPYQISGTGFVTDAGHPMHPGDFHRYDITIRILVNPDVGESVVELESEGETAGTKDIDRYNVRRGRLFQVDDKGVEKRPSPFGDLAAATVAALHPSIIANAIREHRQNLRPHTAGQAALFAWNDELWTVDLDTQHGRIRSLQRAVYNDVLGDGIEKVRFEAWPAGDASAIPGRAVVTLRGREVARFDFGPVTRNVQMDVPAGDKDADRQRVVATAEIELHEAAPHLFTIDVASMNTRVFIAEFSDHLMVLEGAYNSGACERIAAKVQAHFHKPVRYFAFSHLHGQYIGGTRAWVHEGATVLAPPTTVQLIEAVVQARFELRPDALARDPKPLRTETIKDRRTFADSTNTVQVFNVASGHTDEYLIFYFPRQKVLTTGDLLFYRPGKPLTGRSKQLCDTVKTLGLDVTAFYATWPLDGYGTKSIVSGDEFWGACTESK